MKCTINEPSGAEPVTADKSCATKLYTLERYAMIVRQVSYRDPVKNDGTFVYRFADLVDGCLYDAVEKGIELPVGSQVILTQQ